MKVGDRVYQSIDMKDFFITNINNESISLYGCHFYNGDKFEQYISFIGLEKFNKNFITLREIRKMKLKKLNNI